MRAMSTESEGARNLGLMLLGLSLLTGGGAALLYWVSYGEHWNFGPLIFAIIASLGTVILIGVGIKQLIKAASLG